MIELYTCELFASLDFPGFRGLFDINKEECDRMEEDEMDCVFMTRPVYVGFDTVDNAVMAKLLS